MYGEVQVLGNAHVHTYVCMHYHWHKRPEARMPSGLLPIALIHEPLSKTHVLSASKSSACGDRKS